MGSLLGWAIYGISPTYRRHLRENLERAGYRDAHVRRAAIAHAGQMLLETPAMWLRPQNEVASLVRAVDGMAAVDAARAQLADEVDAGGDVAPLIAAAHLQGAAVAVEELEIIARLASSAGSERMSDAWRSARMRPLPREIAKFIRFSSAPELTHASALSAYPVGGCAP